MLQLRYSTPWGQDLEFSSHMPVIINLTTTATGKTVCVYMGLNDVVVTNRYIWLIGKY